jgi:hypothetical protein
MEDVHCWRDERGVAHCSLPQRHKHHSPTGFEFGYGGSGPADLALNIMAVALPGSEAEPGVWLADGTRVSEDAWDLHQDFKSEFVASLPAKGGVIAGVVIEAWVVAQLAQLNR